MQGFHDQPGPPISLIHPTEPGYRPPGSYYPDHVQLLINDLEQIKPYRIIIPFNEQTSISFRYDRDPNLPLQQISVDLHGEDDLKTMPWSSYSIDRNTRYAFNDGIRDYLDALGDIVSSEMLDRYPDYKRNIFGFVNCTSANVLFEWLTLSASAGQTTQDENLMGTIDRGSAFHIGEIQKRMVANLMTDSTLIPQLLKSRNSLLISLGLALRTGDFAHLYQDEIHALITDKTLPEHIRRLLRFDQEFGVEEKQG